MPWPENTIKDWDHFIKIVGALQIGVPPDSAYSFRGQPDSSKSLRPLLLRTIGNLSRAQAVAIESQLLAAFQSHAHLVVPSAQLVEYGDSLSWWTLMQHHGAPTRLLDWTKSPFVAAYFAIAGEPSQDGALWYFHSQRLDEMQEGKGAPSFEVALKQRDKLFFSPCDDRYCYALERKQKTERMITQQGGFTLCSDVLADHATVIADSLVANDKKEWFRKLIIPSTLKPQFLLQLHRLNVTAVALFPGVDGLGRSLVELAVLRADKARAAA